MNLDSVKWKQDYSTGNESVDFQHQHFAALINRISTNLLAPMDTGHTKKLLDELGKYARFHFTSEENIAFELGLKGLGMHHDRHIEMLEELDMHIDDLFSGIYATKDFINFLSNWFIGHTIYEDIKLFEDRL